MINNLTRELSKKILQDLGATPITLGKTSLTHSALSIRDKIKISDENGQIEEVPTWYGELLGSGGLTCCLLSALNKSSEIIFVIGFKTFNGDVDDSSIKIGFQFDWNSESDEGSYFFKNTDDQWLPLTLAQILQFALGMECMVQEGGQWNPGEVPKAFRRYLSEIIDKSCEE